MFRIGEFSKLAKTTVKTLRYYDKVGLLKPAFVDSETSYRYYSEAQLEIMRITEQLTQKFVENADNLSTANKKRLKDITESGKPCARCGFADFTCTEGCKWGKNGALTRTI